MGAEGETLNEDTRLKIGRVSYGLAVCARQLLVRLNTAVFAPLQVEDLTG